MRVNHKLLESSVHQQDLNTFSERLNYLLDKAGFVEGRGRMAAFSFYLKVRKSTVSNWLQKSIYPRGSSMLDILNKLLSDGLLPSNIDKSQLLNWLEHGDAVASNPFLPTATPMKSKTKIYFMVFEEANLLGIQLNDLPDSTLDELIELVFNNLALSTSSVQTRGIIRQSIKDGLKTLIHIEM